MAPRFIKVLSSDGFTFVIPREVALVSGTWQRTLSTETYIESQTGELTLEEPAEIVSTIIDYMFYHLKYRETQGNPGYEFQFYEGFRLADADRALDRLIIG